MKIGVFDSGLGGLTVVHELRRLCPEQEIIYLGDTARVPYGIRSDETVRQYANECASFLMKRNVEAVVVACNTVSAVALAQLKSELDVPVFGVIEPGAEEAVRVAEGAPIGVLGTLATVESGAYGRAIRALSPESRLFSQAAPLLVPLVEEGWLDGDVPRQVIRKYLEPLLDKQIRALILGCTHYPLLKPVIEAELRERVHDPIAIVDSGVALARRLKGFVEKDWRGQPGAGREKGSLSVYVTDAPRRFKALAERFLGEDIFKIEPVKLV